MAKFLSKINDKVLHFLVCLGISIFSTEMAVGAALGKEYGDMNAEGNHWDWFDILADFGGIIVGTGIRLLILWLIFGTFRWNWY